MPRCPRNCGLVVAGSAAPGARHDLRRVWIGREDADCPAPGTGGALGRHDVQGRLDDDAPHVGALDALATFHNTTFVAC